MQEERDDIEKFFAKRLGEKDFPFEEEQWETLAKRLDDESPVKPPFWLRFRKKIGYILIPIITFLIGWYLQRGTEEVMPSETLPTVPQQEIPQEPAQPSVEELNAQEEPTQELKEKAGKPQTVESGSVSSATERTAITEKQEEVASELKEEKRRDGEAGVAIPPIGLKNVAYYNKAPLNLLELDFPFPEMNLALDVAVGDSLLTEQNAFKPEWSVTVLVAPDFNSTNFGDLYSSLGESVGFMLNRRAKEKMQFGFGLLVNNKVYSAGKGEYAPAHAYWTRGIEPDITDAKCLVLEIPVSVGMRLFKTNRGALWGNVGLSSYVFLTEKYDYYYLNNNDPDLNPGWEGKNENKHVAAGLGFSLMYTHQISERSSLIFEPYFKSTIQPVGHGNVDLLSSGLNVGFNYRLFSKK